VIYYGIVDTYGLNADDSMYLDARLDVSAAGRTTSFELLQGVSVPICSDYMEGSEENENGDCPADGVYYFNTNAMLPSIDNALLDWASSGWTGEVVLDLYDDANKTEMIGKCYMEVETHVTGLSENGYLRTKPSAKVTLWTVAGVAAVIMLSCLYCAFCRSSNRDGDANPNTFTRMK